MLCVLFLRLSAVSAYLEKSALLFLDGAKIGGHFRRAKLQARCLLYVKSVQKSFSTNDVKDGVMFGSVAKPTSCPT
jgi:hypothetical protein